MKKIIIAAALFFSLAYGECLTDTKLLVPWGYDNICKAPGYSEYQILVDAKQHLRKLTQEGVFDIIRKDFFPEMEASLEVEADQDIWLFVKSVELDDAIVYCNLCRIYAELLRAKEEESYIKKADTEQRKALLEQLKSLLYDFLHPPLSSAQKVDLSPDSPPPYVLIQRSKNDDRLYLDLFVADSWRACRSAGGEEHGYKQIYRLFHLTILPPDDFCMSVELYQALKEVSRPDYTYAQFLFEKKLLTPIYVMMSCTSPYGCYSVYKLYGLEDIQTYLESGGKVIRTFE